MHDMAVCVGIVGVLEAEARRQDFRRVKSIWLEVGPFSGAEPEAMRFCFDAVAHGTLAENARFEIIATRGTAYCMQCTKDIEIEERFSPCPLCGSHQLQVTGGDELRIKELEVD